MDWLYISEIIAFIFTLLIVIIVFKELKKAIKDDRSGKKSSKCDLD